MAVTLKGLGAVWGVGALTFAGTVITSSVGKYQSMDYEKSADEALLEDENGEVAGEAFFNQTRTLNVTIIPVGSSIANASLNLDACLPTPGTGMAIVDPLSTSVDSTNSGNYVVVSARNGRTNRGFSTVDLQLRQRVAYDVSTTVT